MATYYWIGGFTADTSNQVPPPGVTGVTYNSFVTYTPGGTFGPDFWTNTLNGATSSAGDIFYSPYAWDRPENWKKQMAATGGGISLVGIEYTDIPKGGDTIKFVGYINQSDGTTLRTYSTSLLYAAMTGDGPTSNGMTAWNSSGASSAAERFGDINFSVDRSFVAEGGGTNDIGLNSGQIGVSSVVGGNWSAVSPLRIRTKSFDVSAGTTSYGARIAIDNISTQSGAANYGQRMIADASNSDVLNKQTGKTTSYITGDFKYITIDQGNCYIDNLYPRESGVTSGEGAIVNIGENSKVIGTFSSSRMSNIDKLYVSAAKWNNIFVWGNGTTAAMSLIEVKPFSYMAYTNLYQSLNAICIGDFGSGITSIGGTGPTIKLLRLHTIGEIGTSGPVGGSVSLASAVINYLEGWDGGKIAVHPNVSESDSITIRNGFVKSGFELNMAHPEQSEWSNFFIGGTASDIGIRLDSSNPIVKFFKNQTFKTSSTIPGISGSCI